MVVISGKWEVVSLFGFELSPTGLQPKKGRTPSYREWEQLGEFLRWIEGSIQWLIGDWIAYGDEYFKERSTQAVDATGWKLDTVKQCAWVAGAVPPSRRVPDLSFSHHREVADLPAAQQSVMLNKASAQKWSVDKLRREINVTKHPERVDCWLLVRCTSEADREKLSERLQGEGRSVKLP